MKEIKNYYEIRKLQTDNIRKQTILNLKTLCNQNLNQINNRNTFYQNEFQKILNDPQSYLTLAYSPLINQYIFNFKDILIEKYSINNDLFEIIMIIAKQNQLSKKFKSIICFTSHKNITNRQIPGVKFNHYNQSVQNKKDTLKIMDLSSAKQIESLNCLNNNHINLIYSNISLNPILKQIVAKNKQIEYLQLNQRYDVATVLINNNSEMEETIEVSIGQNIGDIIVFCDEILINEYMKSKKFTSANLINSQAILLQLANLKYVDNKVNIIFAQSYNQLLGLMRMNENITKKIVKIFDYMKIRRVYFDFNQQLYVEDITDIGEEEYKKRRNIVGEYRIGKYYRKKQGKIIKNDQILYNHIGEIFLKFERKDILDRLSGTQLAKKKINECIQFMKKNAVINDKQNIIDLGKTLKKYTTLQINQMLALNSCKNNSQVHLLLITLAYIYTKNSIPFAKSSKIADYKGDLELIREIIKKYSSFKKFIDQQFFSKNRKQSCNSDLQEINLQKQKSLENPKLSTKNSQKAIKSRFKFNEIFLSKWWKEYEQIKENFQNCIEQKIDPKISLNLNLFCKSTGAVFKPDYKSYIDYYQKKDKFSILKNTVLNSLIPTPKYMLIIKIHKFGTNNQILIAQQNTNPPQSLESQSIVEYEHINALIFSKNIIEQFQNQNHCQIEVNQQFQSILIKCKEQNKQNIRNNFKIILEEALSQLKNDSIIAKHGNKYLRMELGGRISEIFRDSKNTALSVAIRNIPNYWNQQDIKSLAIGSIIFSEIKLKKNPQNTTLDAIVSLTKQNDLLLLYDIINNCEIEENKLYLCKENEIKNPFLKNVKGVKLKWYAYYTNKTGEIHFESNQYVLEACKIFPQYCKYNSQQPNSNILILENLEEWTDQEYIKQLFKDIGNIIRIKLKKIAPLQKQIYSLLYYHLGLAVNNLQHCNVHKVQIINQQSGEREIFIEVKTIQLIDKIHEYFNFKLNILGRGRSYVQKVIEYTLSAKISTINLMKRLLQKELEKFNYNKNLIDLDLFAYQDQGYLTLRAKDINLFKITLQNAEILIQGYEIEPDTEMCCFNEYGVKGIKMIQKDYMCQIRSHLQTKKLRVVCDKTSLQSIKKQIKNLGSMKIQIFLKLNSKIVQYFIENVKALKQLLKNISYQIKQTEYEISLEGKIKDIIQAKQNILKYTTELRKQSYSEDQNLKQCQICFEEFSQIPYMLMICRHSFCKQCIDQYIGTCLQNFSMFPLKCPKCSEFISIKDIETLVKHTPKWEKCKQFSIKSYIYKNSKQISYCLTPNCQGIHFLTRAVTKCQFCNNQYCMACKKIYHYGFTCQQAAVGSEVLFQRFLQNHDVRKCPNKSCVALIHKNGGCNKVLCTLCQKSICWKCMNIYDTPQLAYAHLNKVHGGYFDNH